MGKKPVCKTCGNPIPLVLGVAVACPMCNPIKGKFVDVIVDENGLPVSVNGLPSKWKYRVIDLGKKKDQSRYGFKPSAKNTISKFHPPQIFQEMAIVHYKGLLNVHNLPKDYDWSTMQMKCPDLCGNKDIQCHHCHEHSKWIPLKEKNPSVHWVDSYMSLGFGENGMMKNKNGMLSV